MDKLEKHELFLLVIKLNLPDLLNFCQTSKRIKHTIYDKDYIWLYKLTKEYPNWREFKFSKTKSLKDIYISLYQLQTIRQKLNLKYSLLDLYNLQFFDLNGNKITPNEDDIAKLYKIIKY
jgi:hypothetical protein